MDGFQIIRATKLFEVVEQVKMYTWYKNWITGYAFLNKWSKLYSFEIHKLLCNLSLQSNLHKTPIVSRKFLQYSLKSSPPAFKELQKNFTIFCAMHAHMW